MAHTHLDLAAGTQASAQMLLLQQQLLPWRGLTGGARLAAEASKVALLGAVSHLHVHRTAGVAVCSWAIQLSGHGPQSSSSPSCVWACACRSRQPVLEGPTVVTIGPVLRQQHTWPDWLCNARAHRRRGGRWPQLHPSRCKGRSGWERGRRTCRIKPGCGSGLLPQGLIPQHRPLCWRRCEALRRAT